MNVLYQKYLDNLAEGNELVKKNLLTVIEDKEGLLAQIQYNSQRTYQLRLENDELLDKIVHSRKAEDLSAEDVEELKEFADELFVFSHQSDIGTAYYIHRLLLKYAELHDDTDLKIRQYYHLAIALFYINPLMVDLGINPFGKEVTALYRAGANYFEHLEDLESDQTKGYVIRCLTNLCTADERYNCPHTPGTPFDMLSTFTEYEKYFSHMMEVYTNPRYRELSPNFPWDKAIYNLHFNLSAIHQFVRKHHPREIMEKILKSAEFCRDHQEQLASFRFSTRDARVEKTYATIRWKMGQISTTEFADAILEILSHSDINDFSPNGIVLNLQLPIYFEDAYRHMNREDKERYRPHMRRILRDAYDFLFKFPHNEYSNLVTSAVSESVRYRAQHNLSLQKRFFNSLLYCHPPTYIHVRMAAFLSRKLVRRMIDTVPERLLGIYDIFDVNELRERQEEIETRVYQSSLYHDVGKIMLLDDVSVYGRRLLDEEFAAIKLHTNIGATILAKMDPPELSSVALHHHRFYNEMGGYPEVCPPSEPQYKHVVDIVSVSDTVEAATDNIGRCYSAPKSLAEIVVELKAESGTRYSPAVVSLFDDEAFFAEVERELAEQRRDIYFEAYGKNKKSK